MRLPNALAALAAPALVSALDLRLITYNIRLATSSPGNNELPWSDRRPLLAEQLENETSNQPSTLMCFQEAFADVVDEINSDLGRSWSYTGDGRDDGEREGEYTPIFYRNDVWDLSGSRTVWLSETPNEPSRGWDATHNRIVTIAELHHQDSGAQVVFMCTHFDWEGKTAQGNSADIILGLADAYSSAPVFVAGDLNLEPGEAPYEALVSGLSDFREMAGGEDADVLTYTGFTEDEEQMLIDFIFVKDADTVSGPSYSVPSNIKDGEYISDHRPVIVDVEVL